MSEKFIPTNDLAVRGILHLHPIGYGAITQVGSLGPLGDDALQVELAYQIVKFGATFSDMVEVQQA